MSLDLLGIAALASIPVALTLARGNPPPPPPPLDAQLFFHIKNDPASGLVTKGKVAQIYQAIQNFNVTDFEVGLQPQCVTDWAAELEYLSEFQNIPVMLSVFTSDNAYQMGLGQILDAMAVCPVKYLRFHEVMAYYRDVLPEKLPYIQSVLAFSRDYGIPIFWNEWDVNSYPQIKEIIQGYEDNVLVSFGTNCNWVEPVDGYQLLQQFRRRAASVQSWYWWERNGRVDGYELTMPPELMAQHTQQAFLAGCEIVQYEPYSYFFMYSGSPKTSLPQMFSAMI